MNSFDFYDNPGNHALFVKTPCPVYEEVSGLMGVWESASVFWPRWSEQGWSENWKADRLQLARINNRGGTSFLHMPKAILR